MIQDGPPNIGEEATPHHKFVAWLKNNMLHSYQQSLEDEGFEELEALTLLSPEEIEELASAIKMKFGHKKKFPVAISKAREEFRRIEKERNRKMKEQEELAKIETGRKLADAKAQHRRDTPVAASEVNTKDKSTAKPGGSSKSDKGSTPVVLPSGKRYHYFA